MKSTTPNSWKKYFWDFEESMKELKELSRWIAEDSSDNKALTKTIRSFEITHELAITTIGEYFKAQGRKPFTGSREATVEAFNEDLVDDGAGWLEMIICRIKINPLYPGDYEAALIKNIKSRYLVLLEDFQQRMGKLVDIQ
jgi:hypothetical protein